ncbi:hypothetical protein UFOVP95_4 [uncultured Caudovirales phage]|uniref:Uncharacterized protein n=1 Tax=uncultured Caudovirales phage TaxID=2100421 RepID=A0A6J5L2U2_9CAUD|nr:hypothetical protein UFOVP95_4 [uncultured Caudovirales phage]
MENVWVVNKSNDELKTQWHGKHYIFPRSKPVEVPYDVAQNVFGYRLDDKFEFVVRFGWTKDSNDLLQAYERLSKFEISEQRPKDYRATSPAVDQFPVPVLDKLERGKGTQAAA